MEKLNRDKLTRQPIDKPKLPESQEMTTEDQAWLEADTEGELPPYNWGEIDPLTLGKPVEYIPGEGTVIVEE